MVHGCGRASEQGRGPCQNRHIAHPSLPAPFLLQLHNGDCVFTQASSIHCPSVLPGSCLPLPPTPTHPPLSSVASSQYGCQWPKAALLGELGGVCARRH